MSEELHSKLVAFLANALARTEHDTVVKIELTYSPQGGYRPDPLRVWKRDDPNDQPFFIDEDGKPNHVYTQKLASEMVELATGHADSYGTGKHRFVVRAHKHINGWLTHAFVVLPSFDSDDQALVGPGGTELAPTNAGIVAQLMRHLETNHRAASQKDNAIFATFGQQLQQAQIREAALHARISELEHERTEWMAAIESAKSQEHQRQIEALAATSREERKTMVTKKFSGLLPVLASKLIGSGKSKPTGKDGANGTAVKPPSPLAQLAHKLLDSLDEDQRAQIAMALGMEQQILLVEISDVVGNGDSMMLPTMLHDFASALTPAQIQTLMELMSAEQRVMFVQAMKLAATATQTAEAVDSKSSAQPTETEVS